MSAPTATSAQDPQSRLEATFRSEAEGILDRFEIQLEQLEKEGLSSECVNDLFRLAHNLKGAAKTAGFAKLGELAHVLEELLTRWRSRALTPDFLQIQWARAGLEVLRECLNQSLQRTTTATAAQAGTTRRSSQEEQAIRVPFSALADALQTSTQATLVFGQVESLVNTLARQHTDLLDHLAELSRLLTLQQDQLVQVRLVPAASLLDRLDRVLQTTGKQVKKSIHVEIRGRDTEIDAGLLETLRDPLIHIARNAVSHGIEDVEQRQRRGKSPFGRIQVHAEKRAGSFVFVIGDDGGGLDRQRILTKAIGQHLLPEHTALTDPAVLQAIFLPGFSTATAIDEVSGRGVGLDVVRHALDKVRGTIDITTNAGEGTTFTISVPMSLSTLQGLHVEVGEQVYVLPAEQVIECVDAVFEARDDGTATFTACLRHSALPCIALRPILRPQALGAARSPKHNPLVVVRHEGRMIGLMVDAIRGEKRTVLRPLSPLFLNNRCVSAVTVLGDGEVGLLLDVRRIVDDHSQSERSLQAA